MQGVSMMVCKLELSRYPQGAPMERFERTLSRIAWKLPDEQAFDAVQLQHEHPRLIADGPLQSTVTSSMPGKPQRLDGIDPVREFIVTSKHASNVRSRKKWDPVLLSSSQFHCTYLISLHFPLDLENGRSNHCSKVPRYLQQRWE
jgi:hypothetical protein